MRRMKRFQYWSFKDGKPQILWSEWFNYDGPEEPIQLKGFKGNHLLNEYRDKPAVICRCDLPKNLYRRIDWLQLR